MGCSAISSRASTSSWLPLMLSGLGRLGTDSTDLLWRPETTAGTAGFTVCWLVLTLVGHRVQAGSSRVSPQAAPDHAR